MQTSERQANGISIIDVSGDVTVTAENARGLIETVTAVLLRGERRIVLNFANLQHVNSSCLGEIVESYKTIASNGGILKLANVGPHLRSVLRTTTLDTILEGYNTEAEAIASFGNAPLPEPGRTMLSGEPLWPTE